MEQEIDVEVKSLETCAYNSTTFREILAKIQKAVDNLSLHSFSNLPQWVAKLDEEVKKKPCTLKIWKLLTPRKIVVIILKFKQCAFIIEEYLQKIQTEWQTV